MSSETHWRLFFRGVGIPPTSAWYWTMDKWKVKWLFCVACQVKLFLISKFDLWGFQELIPIDFLSGITLLGRFVFYFSQGSDCTQRHAAKISGWQSLPGDRCSGGRAVWHGAAAHFERLGGARRRTSPGLGGLWASKDVKGRLWSYDTCGLQCFAVVWLEHVLNFDSKIGFDAVKVGSEPTNMEVYWLLIVVSPMS